MRGVIDWRCWLASEGSVFDPAARSGAMGACPAEAVPQTLTTGKPRLAFTTNGTMTEGVRPVQRHARDTRALQSRFPHGLRRDHVGIRRRDPSNGPDRRAARSTLPAHSAVPAVGLCAGSPCEVLRPVIAVSQTPFVLPAIICGVVAVLHHLLAGVLFGVCRPMRQPAPAPNSP